MAIKRRSKIKAEFSVSSMTDVVFLLLIFFMLTSSLVTPNALKLLLPKATNPALANQTIRVSIDDKLNYYIESDQISKESLQQLLQKELANTDEAATIVINADETVPIKEITHVMVVGKNLNKKVILATRTE